MRSSTNACLFIIIADLSIRWNQHRRRIKRAISVYDHGFRSRQGVNARVVFPVNRTSDFIQDDRFVYAFVTAAFYSADFTQEWYDPSGICIRTRLVMQMHCFALHALIRLHVADTGAATRFGVWRMDLLVDGFRLYSDYFTLTSVITQEITGTLMSPNRALLVHTAI